MTKFAAIVRRSMLSVFMVLFLIACVTKVESNTSFGEVLYMGMLISIGIYILFSTITIIVRLIKRIFMGKHDAMMSAYTDVPFFMGNLRIINYFRRISFWGMIMLLINVIVLNVPGRMIVGGPYSSDTFLYGYHGFLLWAIISLILLFIISILFFAIYLPHYGTGAYNVFQFIGKLLLADIATPFTVVKSFFSKKEEDKKSFGQVIRFITLAVFIVINAFAIIKTI